MGTGVVGVAAPLRGFFFFSFLETRGDTTVGAGGFMHGCRSEGLPLLPPLSANSYPLVTQRDCLYVIHMVSEGILPRKGILVRKESVAYAGG